MAGYAQYLPSILSTFREVCPLPIKLRDEFCWVVALNIVLEMRLCISPAERFSLMPIRMYNMVIAIIGRMKKNNVDISNEFGNNSCFREQTMSSGLPWDTTPNCIAYK